MKYYKSGNQYDTQVEYTAEGDLLVTNAKEELITDLLWATHLYATFRFELSSNKDFWKDTMDMLYEMMKDECDWESELAKTDRDSYLEANKVAMKILIEHWLKNEDTDVKELKTEVPKDIDSKCVSQLQARIAEKDAEIASLKKQLEECQNNDSYNDEQEAKQDEKVLYNKVSHEFFLRLLEKAGLDLNNTGNKTRVGDLWHMVTGKSGDEIRRYCSTRNYINSHTRVDIKRLNELLQDMKIGDFQLPIS